MDISTVAKGSGRETFVGQSGMNQGTGIGALTDLIKLGVGRLLTWKNRPVYDKLSAIIEDDLLGLVKARVPDLEQKRTAFAEPGAKPASHAFESADGKCKGHVAAYKGGKVDWITTCSFFSESLGFGNLRIDGWTDRSTRAPNMAVHLCIVFNVRRPLGLSPPSLCCAPSPLPPTRAGALYLYLAASTRKPAPR